MRIGQIISAKLKNSRVTYHFQIRDIVKDGFFGDYRVARYSDGKKQKNPALHHSGFFPTRDYTFTILKRKKL
jgi:hypothetical protein